MHYHIKPTISVYTYAFVVDTYMYIYMSYIYLPECIY